MTENEITVRESVVAEIAARNAYHLAGDADCATPDRLDSPGAILLTSVRDATLEALEGVELDDLDRINDNGAISEIADGGPSIYTYTKWQEFVDLAAWQEDISELGGSDGDMDKAGSIALYIIAERLAYALVEQVKEAAQEDADLDEEEEDTEDE